MGVGREEETAGIRMRSLQRKGKKGDVWEGGREEKRREEEGGGVGSR